MCPEVGHPRRTAARPPHRPSAVMIFVMPRVHAPRPHGPARAQGMRPSARQWARDLLDRRSRAHRSRVAAPGFEPGKAEPADLQRADSTQSDQAVPSLWSRLGDAWGKGALVPTGEPRPGAPRPGRPSRLFTRFSGSPESLQKRTKSRVCLPQLFFGSITWLVAVGDIGAGFSDVPCAQGETEDRLPRLVASQRTIKDGSMPQTPLNNGLVVPCFWHEAREWCPKLQKDLISRPPADSEWRWQAHTIFRLWSEAIPRTRPRQGQHRSLLLRERQAKVDHHDGLGTGVVENKGESEPG
ncbi:hypothetical protein SAMN05216533_3515 [Streptomyces sp. Ag109_O5-10]|nr:hypothetical protein SAMN05216533_3515 [Streptomyces sp. Ag109_O5-10]